MSAPAFPEYAAQVAARCRAALRVAGIDDATAADALGITVPTLHRHLSGRVPLDVIEVMRIHGLTGESFAALMGAKRVEP